MNYVILNADGSLLAQNLEYYIQQGNSGDEIFVGLVDGLQTDVAIAVCTLPNETQNTVAGVWGSEDIEIEGVTTTYNGWTFTLTTDQTTYNGLLRLAVRITRNNQILVSYPIALVINETGVMPDTDTGVTVEEINSYLLQIQGLESQLDSKVDKLSTLNSYVYTHVGSTQSEVAYSSNNDGNTIALREADGTLKVATPTDSSDATTKDYVDTKISNLELRSDVVDIVGTYADLQSYDTSSLTENDIVKVLRDETRLDRTSYYRWVSGSWVFIGYEGPYVLFTEFLNTVDLLVPYTGAEKNLDLGSHAAIARSFLSYKDAYETISAFGENKIIVATAGADIEEQPTDQTTYTFPIVTGGATKTVATVEDTYTQTQVDNLLGAKQDTLTFDDTPTENSSNPVTSDGIYDALQDVREVAEGRCKTFITSYALTAPTEATFSDYNYYRADDTQIESWADLVTYLDGSTIDNAILNSSNNEVDMSQESILVQFSDGYKVILPVDNGLKNGDIILVIETDVPDRWIKEGEQSTYLEKLETTKVDLTNYVDLTSAQTITGTKTFDNIVLSGTTSSTTGFIQLGSAASNFISLSSYSPFFSSNSGEIKTNASFVPSSTNTRDLGTSSSQWKDLYLSNAVDFAGVWKLFYTSALYFSRGGSNKIGLLSDVMRLYNYDLYFSGTSKLTDGTNSYSIADSYGLLYNKYVSDDTITGLPYKTMSIISISADTTFTMVTAPTGCYPEYKAKITNSGASSIDLTFTGVTNILCNDDNITISTNVLTLPASTTIEISIVDNLMVAVNFEVA